MYTNFVITNLIGLGQQMKKVYIILDFLGVKKLRTNKTYMALNNHIFFQSLFVSNKMERNIKMSEQLLGF